MYTHSAQPLGVKKHCRDIFYSEQPHQRINAQNNSLSYHIAAGRQKFENKHAVST